MIFKCVLWSLRVLPEYVIPIKVRSQEVTFQGQYHSFIYSFSLGILRLCVEGYDDTVIFSDSAVCIFSDARVLQQK